VSGLRPAYGCLGQHDCSPSKVVQLPASRFPPEQPSDDGAEAKSGGRGLRLVRRNPLKTVVHGVYDGHMADEFVDDDPEYEGDAEIDEDVDVADRVPANPEEMPDDLGDVGEMERPGYES
jgi:hypothetical protein